MYFCPVFVNGASMPYHELLCSMSGPWPVPLTGDHVDLVESKQVTVTHQVFGDLNTIKSVFKFDVSTCPSVEHLSPVKAALEELSKQIADLTARLEALVASTASQSGK